MHTQDNLWIEIRDSPWFFSPGGSQEGGILIFRQDSHTEGWTPDRNPGFPGFLSPEGSREGAGSPGSSGPSSQRGHIKGKGSLMQLPDLRSQPCPSSWNQTLPCPAWIGRKNPSRNPAAGNNPRFQQVHRRPHSFSSLPSHWEGAGICSQLRGKRFEVGMGALGATGDEDFAAFGLFQSCSESSRGIHVPHIP